MGRPEMVVKVFSSAFFIDPPSYPPPRRGEGTLSRVSAPRPRPSLLSFIDPPPYPSPRRGRGTLSRAPLRVRTTRAGIPTATAPGGRSDVTTAPAPTTTSSPRQTPP